MDFGESISRICEIEGINLKEFSHLTGIGYSTLLAYKSGSRQPSLQNVEKITRNVRFAKYTNLLMSRDSETAGEEEFIALFRQVCEAGKGDEALNYLKFLAAREGK